METVNDIMTIIGWVVVSGAALLGVAWVLAPAIRWIIIQIQAVYGSANTIWTYHFRLEEKVLQPIRENGPTAIGWIQDWKDRYERRPSTWWRRVHIRFFQKVQIRLIQVTYTDERYQVGDIVFDPAGNESEVLWASGSDFILWVLKPKRGGTV